MKTVFKPFGIVLKPLFIAFWVHLLYEIYEKHKI